MAGMDCVNEECKNPLCDCDPCYCTEEDQCGCCLVWDGESVENQMWLFLISNIGGSILGSAADSWFADTKLGIWFYNKVDDVSTWASKKLGLKVLQDESNWKKKYPNVSKKLDELEARLEKIEKEN